MNDFEKEKKEKFLLPERIPWEKIMIPFSTLSKKKEEKKEEINEEDLRKIFLAELS